VSSGGDSSGPLGNAHASWRGGRARAREIDQLWVALNAGFAPAAATRTTCGVLLTRDFDSGRVKWQRPTQTTFLQVEQTFF
jgi:hypothetical protein